MKMHHVPVAMAVLVAVLTLSGCQKGSAQKKDASQDMPVLLLGPEDKLTLGTSEHGTGPLITGAVQPERRADLRAEVSALVQQVLKDNGELVHKGDLLVRLDATSIRDSLTSADEALRAATQAFDQAERQVQRQKTLQAQGMTSTQSLEDAEIRRNTAQSDLVAAKARVVAARQQLQRTLVRAPFDGVVSERKASAGDTVQIGKELLKVIDPASMRFEGMISADNIGSVKAAQPVSFRVNGYGDEVFVGKIRRVNPAANATTRQVEVLVDFAEKKQPKLAGLYAEGRVETDTSNGLILPPTAIVRAGPSTAGGSAGRSRRRGKPGASYARSFPRRW